MLRWNLTWVVLSLLVLFVLTTCAPIEALRDTLVPPAAPRLVLIPFAISKATGPAGRGWASWSLSFAIENRGSSLYTGDWPAQGLLQTKEGFTYQVAVGPGRLYMRPPSGSLVIPPGFMVKGYGSDPLEAFGEIGEATTPQTFILNGVGECNVEAASPEPLNPTELADNRINSVPDTIEIPGIAQITIEGFADIITDNPPRLLMKVSYKNLDIGHDQYLRNVSIIAVGKQGYESPWDGYIVRKGVCGGYDWQSNPFGAGPGQAVSSQLCLPLWWGSKGGLGLPTIGLNVIFQLKDHNILKIYNTGQ